MKHSKINLLGHLRRIITELKEINTCFMIHTSISEKGQEVISGYITVLFSWEKNIPFYVMYFINIITIFYIP